MPGCIQTENDSARIGNVADTLQPLIPVCLGGCPMVLWMQESDGLRVGALWNRSTQQTGSFRFVVVVFFYDGQ